MNSDIRRLRSNSPAALRPHKTRIILDKYSIKRFSKFAPTVAQGVILSCQRVHTLLEDTGIEL